MKLLVKDKDLSELVESITWGGDSGQISRKLEFTVAQNVLDKNFLLAAVNEGDQVLFQDPSGTCHLRRDHF